MPSPTEIINKSYWTSVFNECIDCNESIEDAEIAMCKMLIKHDNMLFRRNIKSADIKDYRMYLEPLSKEEEKYYLHWFTELNKGEEGLAFHFEPEDMYIRPYLCYSKKPTLLGVYKEYNPNDGKIRAEKARVARRKKVVQELPKQNDFNPIMDLDIGEL